MTKSVKRLVRKKQRHYNMYMETRLQHDYDRYKAPEKNASASYAGLRKNLSLTQHAMAISVHSTPT